MKKNLITSIFVLIGLTFLTSCKDEKAKSSLPAFASLTTDSTTYHMGSTIGFKVAFSDPGENIAAYYNYKLTCISKGETQIISQSQSTVRVTPCDTLRGQIIAPDTIGTFTLTVSTGSVAAFAGNQPYIDGSSMGKLETKINVVK